MIVRKQADILQHTHIVPLDDVIRDSCRFREIIELFFTFFSLFKELTKDVILYLIGFSVAILAEDRGDRGQLRTHRLSWRVNCASLLLHGRITTE